MKRGRNPTVKQMKVMQSNGMDPTVWLVSKVLPDRLECIHRYTERLKSAYFSAVSL